MGLPKETNAESNTTKEVQDSHLSKGAFHATQEVCIFQPIMIAADVVDFKS